MYKFKYFKKEKYINYYIFIKFMKKYQKYLIKISFGILILAFILYFSKIVALSPYDELWNFQNVYKMSQGLKLYTNANAIITPLYYVIGVAILKIFGTSLISFRIYNIILVTVLIILVYTMFRNLKISKHISVLFISVMFIEIFQVMFAGPNYSTLAVDFILIGLIQYLKNEDWKYFHYFQGLIIFLVFFSKQNLGVYYALGIIIYEFIYRKDLKNYILNQLKKFIIFIIPLAISMIAMYKIGNLQDFINYAFGGLLNFGENNTDFKASFYLLIIFLTSIILGFVMVNKKIVPDRIISQYQRKNITLLLSISFTCTLSVFPIVNDAHFIFIFPLYFTILVYILDFIMFEDFFDTESMKIFTYVLSIVLLIAIILRLIVLYFWTEKDFKKIDNISSVFYNVRVSEEDYEKINGMPRYIKNQNKNGKEVVILAYDSAYSMIQLNQNNNELDLVFYGNLGYDGINKTIEKIKNMTNTQFLIMTDEEDMFWQEPNEIRDYITNNLKKVGEILNYSIYE